MEFFKTKWNIFYFLNKPFVDKKDSFQRLFSLKFSLTVLHLPLWKLVRGGKSQHILTKVEIQMIVLKKKKERKTERQKDRLW